MKESIHPICHDVTFDCTCGSKYKVKSTSDKGKSIKVTICSNCHPAYTGKKKTIDETGRIEKFMKKHGLSNG